MKKIAVCVLFLSALPALCRGDDEPKKPKKGEGDLATIRAAVESYVDAFNAGDAKRVAAHWSENGVYVRRDTGEKAAGRAAIQSMHEQLFARQKGIKLKLAVDSLRLITSDVAVEDGTAWVTSPGEDEELTTYSAIHVRGKGGWKLDSVRETAAPGEAESAPPQAQEQLKQLEWMLGKWIDASDDATVEYSANYAKGNNYIVRLFKVSAPGVNDLEGTQIIGWDAAAGVLRSWVFDAEGGFSQGTMSRKGSRWFVKSTGYTADGKTTSALGSFRQIDENTLGWQMTEREVGGEELPDVPEVKIVRKR